MLSRSYHSRKKSPYCWDWSTGYSHKVVFTKKGIIWRYLFLKNFDQENKLMIKNKAYVHEIRKFYVGVVQRRLRNVQKKRDHVHSGCFAYLNDLFFFFDVLVAIAVVVAKLPIVVIQKLCYHGNKTSHFSLLPPTLNFPLYSTFSGETSSLSLQSNMSLMPFVAILTGCWIWQCGWWKQSRKPCIF